MSPPITTRSTQKDLPKKKPKRTRGSEAQPSRKDGRQAGQDKPSSHDSLREPEEDSSRKEEQKQQGIFDKIHYQCDPYGILLAKVDL